MTEEVKMVQIAFLTLNLFLIADWCLCSLMILDPEVERIALPASRLTDRSRSPVKRRRSTSSASRSPARKGSRGHSSSPSKSRSPVRRRSPSPGKKRQSPSPPRRRRSPSADLRRRRSPSPARNRRSPSPARRRRSPSLVRRRRSPSPPARRRYSRSPVGRSQRSRSPEARRRRSRSPFRYRTGRSLSPAARRRSRSRSRRRAQTPPDISSLSVPTWIKELFKLSVITLLERPTCRLPVNISSINDIMRSKDRSYHIRDSIPGCTTFRSLCQWFERDGLIKLVQRKDSVMLASSKLEDQVKVKPARSRSRSRSPRRRMHGSRSRSPRRLLQGPPRDDERWEMSAEAEAAIAGTERWDMGDGGEDEQIIEEKGK